MDTFFIIAGGPSAAGLDFEPLKEHGYILGVNDAAFNAHCHGVISMDGRWMRNRWDKLKDSGLDMFFRKSSVGKWLGHPEHDKLKPFWVNCLADGLSEQWHTFYAKNSGFMALQYAYLMKPKRIYLFGFDLTTHQGKEHWYPGYEWRREHKEIKTAKEWAADHDLAAVQCKAQGIEVFNVSQISIITAYPQIEYREVLQCLK